MMWEGAQWDRLQGNAIEGLKVFSDPAATGSIHMVTQGSASSILETWWMKLANSSNSAPLITTGDRLHVDGSDVVQPISSADIGIAGINRPSANTALYWLSEIAKKIDIETKTVATEATTKRVLAVLSKPVPKPYSTLLHRSI
jgi:hypothetical protein